MLTENRTNGLTGILYFHSNDFTGYPGAACAVHNYRTCEWSSKSNVDELTKRKNRHIRSYVTHWGPLNPSVKINESRSWTPTLNININTKIAKDLHTTGLTYRRTYRRICYTATQGI